MTAHHHTRPHRKPAQFWLREETILGTLSAFLAFALIYAYTGDADIYYPLIGALGMGAVLYTVVWLGKKRLL